MASLTETFVKEMERRILTGEWKAGERIPSLRSLAEEFHVSRSVINAGIAELCNDGYLTTLPRQYICVSDWHKTGTFSVLSGLIENGMYDDTFFSDLLEGRMTIEKAIARKSAEARTEADVKELRRLIEREKRCATPTELARADGEFHHMIAVTSHNLVYAVIFNSFEGVEQRFIRAFYENDVDKAFVMTTHKRLVDAIERHDADEAEKQMELLLLHGERELKQIKKK